MPLHSIMKDRVTLAKRDGQRFEDVPASVSPNRIITDQSELPIEEGDTFERLLPNGLVERFEIVERGFHAQHGGFPAHYQCKVSKASQAPPPSGPTVYNITGPNARVNINSTDLSANVVNMTTETLFAELRKTLSEGISDEDRRTTLLAKVADLEESRGKPTFTASYRAFIAAAADHMTLLGPFIPALAQLLQ